MKTWSTFEDNVRDLATAIWSKLCRPEHIAGVDIDGVIDIDTDICVLIEITVRKDLNKVREDIVKLQAAAAGLMQSKRKYARCFCIIEGDVTRSMIEAGEPHNIKVFSFKQFTKLFFDFDLYSEARINTPFGSAVNPLTGRRDDTPYVPVTYRDERSHKDLRPRFITG